MKLFPKLACAVSVLLALSIFALCASFYMAEQRSIRAQAREERRVLLQNLVHITREALVAGDDLLLVKYTRWLQRWNPAVVSLSVVNPKGEILAHSEPAQIGAHIQPDHAASEGKGQPILVQTQAVQLGGRWVGTVSAGFSEEKLEDAIRIRIRSLQKRLALIAFGAFLGGIGISFLLAHSWIIPIHHLAKAAERVGRGEYELGLEKIMQRRDELGFLSRSFQNMARQLQKLDAMKEDFVSAVTHELRSPLGAIESYLNLIHDELQEGMSSSSWKTYVERLRINTQRLTRFVNDLLDVAALERGHLQLAREAIRLDVLLLDVLLLYEAKLAEKRLHCQTSFPAHAARTVYADPEKIRQVMINLLSNAIKFTPEEGTIVAGIEDMRSSPHVRVFVKDSGIGIAPEDQNRIFNKFEQVTDARLRVKGPKGTGLGLAICKNLVAAHEGTLTVQSRTGEGSCFSFTLPAKIERLEPV